MIRKSVVIKKPNKNVLTTDIIKLVKIIGGFLIMNKNEELREVQAAWVKEKLETYIADCNDKNNELYKDKERKRKGYELSCPFCMGLTKEYIENKDYKKKVMIVGQQPLGFGCWEDHRKDFYKDIESEWSHINLQKWAIEYLDTQLKNVTKSEIKYNPSPFWRLFHALYKDYALCWNDIDKVYYGKKDKDGKKDNDYHEGTLTYAAEEVLSAPFKYDRKDLSLVQREIEIAEPDVVVFVTGPSYALSMGTALGYEKTSQKDINGICPTKEKPVVKLKDVKFNDINKDIKVLWTYHPGYLAQTKDDDNNSLFNIVIDNIKNLI